MKKSGANRDGFWRGGIRLRSSGRLNGRRFHGRECIEKVKVPSIRCGRSRLRVRRSQYGLRKIG